MQLPTIHSFSVYSIETDVVACVNRIRFNKPLAF